MMTTRDMDKYKGEWRRNFLQFLLTRGLVDDGKDTFYITPESGGEVSLIIEIRVWFNNTQNFTIDSSSWFQITSYNTA